MPVTRMIIGEAATDDLATEVIAKMHEHARILTGLITHSILVEEGGRIVILITDWPDRDSVSPITRAGHTANSSPVLLVGDYLVKLFQQDQLGLTSPTL